MLDAAQPHPDRLIVQCDIPTLAARAVKVDTIRARARASGIMRAALRHTPYRLGRAETRVTTHVDVARFLVDELRKCAAISSRGTGPGKAAVVIACSEAAGRLMRAIDSALAVRVEAIGGEVGGARAEQAG